MPEKRIDTDLHNTVLNSRRRLISWLLLIVLMMTGPRAHADEPRYDLVLRNGRIVDGTGNPWYQGDLAIQGDRIVAVGRISKKGKREIDASQMIIAPGFIDIHSHSDTLLLEDGSAQSKIRQGVTLEVLGEGDSVGPSLGKLPSRKLVKRDRTLQWSTLGEYFDTLEREGTALNVASYVGLGTIWRCVMGDSFEHPNDDQQKQMRELVRQAMSDGAMGMSSMLAMPPGSLATTAEIVELCREVASAGGIYSSHIRNEGSGVFEAVKEAIEIGETAKIPVDIIHLKIADQKYWGRMKEIVELIDHLGDRAQQHSRPIVGAGGSLLEHGAAFLIDQLDPEPFRGHVDQDLF